ncbi:competence type IV pilus major pilin ComGC [Aquibacillus sediminis]|uniref:competence type IV pilus major pilin ComGC n=1 Tax=Aquibacillus sediminis TaxID=2574734 RepID=UPI0011084B37|nr:competence type IV pilus major pilin ComGC [Aquibacillus sediminis]
MHNEKGFTLIEMLIVLAVISTLLILLIPNLADKNEDLQDSGCEALEMMAESQIQAYRIEENKEPESIDDLIENDYLQSKDCANGQKEIEWDGEKVEAKNASE